jgi:hypothetical protein
MGESQPEWTAKDGNARRTAVRLGARPEADHATQCLCGGLPEVREDAHGRRAPVDEVGACPACPPAVISVTLHISLLGKHRRDIGESQSTWTGSKMETAGSPRARRQASSSHSRMLSRCWPGDVSSQSAHEGSAGVTATSTGEKAGWERRSASSE